MTKMFLLLFLMSSSDHPAWDHAATLIGPFSNIEECYHAEKQVKSMPGPVFGRCVELSKPLWDE